MSYEEGRKCSCKKYIGACISRPQMVPKFNSLALCVISNGCTYVLECLRFLNPTGYVDTLRSNIKKVLSAQLCIYVLFTYVGTNSDLCLM
jgi:hypothetical protein